MHHSKDLSVILLACLFLGFGCNTESPPEDPAANLTRGTFSELLERTVEQVSELSFCVSEGAGAESLKDPATKIVQLAEALRGSAAGSGLPAAKQSKLSSALAKIEKVCDRVQSKISEGATEFGNLRIQEDIAAPLSVLSSLSGNP